MSQFRDKVVIVTGAASGIGRALSEELARRGASVTLADINPSPVEEAAETITKAGHKAETFVLDVSDYDAVGKMVADTVARYGHLDYLFNNAGIAVGGEVRDCSIDDFRNVINVNLFGVVNGVAAAYSLMVKQGYGHIINTASLEGLIPFPATVSYVASKYGVVGLSNALRIEGVDLGVKVSVVCPGYIKTPIFQTSKMIKIDREKMLKSLPERFGITSEACAQIILRGVQRNKAIIVVTGFAKVLWALQRISPAVIRWMMRRDLRKSRKEMRIED
ncbi:MAG: SDR family oxidoreductase [Deltaproteobacteria bacterium]|uniref:SDR family oxidoreductase n=1 Tax=Candidatus Desulfacyla euxinica TaxID=2841693 RepID=A0A8J6MVN7_9DELT|nr:SDR family oxidoreductase [Candidatus Desulfacyla euxinica]